MEYIEASARISSCGKFRYELTRQWNPLSDDRFVLWCMLNPSKADGKIDDPTIRKCVGFTAQWGYHRLVVVNMFAYRATDPRELKKAGHPSGPSNHMFIREHALKADLIVAAWGNHALKTEVPVILELLRPGGPSCALKCLGKTKSGQPRHPLMVGYSTPLEDYR